MKKQKEFKFKIGQQVVSRKYPTEPSFIILNRKHGYSADEENFYKIQNEYRTIFASEPNIGLEKSDMSKTLNNLLIEIAWALRLHKVMEFITKLLRKV